MRFLIQFIADDTRQIYSALDLQLVTIQIKNNSHSESISIFSELNRLWKQETPRTADELK